MSKKHLVLFLTTLFLNCTDAKKTSISKDFHQWAQTPPMGWNSWDCFGPSVIESEVKANADYIATHLKEYGWEYIVVDIRWYVDNQTTGHYNPYGESNFILDEYGRYQPSPTRFPSSKGGKGFKPLADYIHSLGLKFGIHIMRGIPKEAVNNQLPIKGTSITANQVYATVNECTWLKDNYTILKSKKGGQEYYDSILELYASWGVDYIKVDDLSRPYHNDEIEMIRSAIDKTGRPIVLSMSPGATPIEENKHARANANLWRTIDDFWDNWSQLNYSFEKCAEWAPFIQKGAWPDADMLPLGHLSIRGERGADRYTNFTKDEQYTLMTLWTIFKSPLMFGGHTPDNDEFTNSLLTNKEVLFMHSNSINNKQLYKKGDIICWTADDPISGDKFVALFNNEGDGFVNTDKILYRSGPITKLTDGYGVNLTVTLPKKSKMLYLIVNDNGDTHSCDHANWIAPSLLTSDGRTIDLVDQQWEFASQGWGKTQTNKSVSGRDLIVNKNKYAKGIGTHAQSIIQYRLPEKAIEFSAFAGLDQQGMDEGCGSTVEFMIAVEDPRINPDEIKSTEVNLDLAELGIFQASNIRDLWRKEDLGVVEKDEFKISIPQHGSVLYRISKAN